MISEDLKGLFRKPWLIRIECDVRRILTAKILLSFRPGWFTCADLLIPSPGSGAHGVGGIQSCTGDSEAHEKPNFTAINGNEDVPHALGQCKRIRFRMGLVARDTVDFEGIEKMEDTGCQASFWLDFTSGIV
jgi:hypothetical protein